MLMDFYNKYVLPKLLDKGMKREEMNKLRPGVVEGASGVVLEIGFGSGLNLPYYKNTSKLYALDPSRELYELSKDKTGSASFPIEYLEASAEKIPLPDNSVDTVVSAWTLCSIPHPEIALREVVRVLKPNEKFMFIEHGTSPKSFWKNMQKLETYHSCFQTFHRRMPPGQRHTRSLKK
jgi:ubiquinone/menaquinone biosynthesis C-methylase UbiE